MDRANKQANDLNLLNMIESRIMEIIQIEDECKRKLPKLYHQRLPRFMRRRAASHNMKRLPKKMRPSASSKFGSKSRKSLLSFRRKTRFQKHKRVLRKHSRHKYNEPFKSLLHKWFAKRFKMGDEGAMNYVPMYNNTKNQRNLYRQTRYGCAYLSMNHLIAVQLVLCRPEEYHLAVQLEQLNRISCPVSGFTFCAQSIEKGKYEVVVHLYKLDSLPREYICPAIVEIKGAQEGDNMDPLLTMWIPRNNYQEILNYLETISRDCTKQFKISTIYPRDWIRVRLIGPNARDECCKVALDKERHKAAIEDATLRLDQFGLTIGRHIEEKSANFTYYNTDPIVADIVFKKQAGRMLWHQLVKNKAHLVGGFRDLDRLLVADCFKLVPDF